MMKYSEIINHHASNSPSRPSSIVNKTIDKRAMMAKMYLISFPLNDHCLNFKANIGSSQTSKKLVMHTKASITNADQL